MEWTPALFAIARIFRETKFHYSLTNSQNHHAIAPGNGDPIDPWRGMDLRVARPRTVSDCISMHVVRRLFSRAGELALIAVAAGAPLLYGSATGRSVAVLLLLSSFALLAAPAPQSRSVTCAVALVLGALGAWGCVAFLQMEGMFPPAWGIDLFATSQSVANLGANADSAFTLNASRFYEALLRAGLVTAILLAAILHGQSRNACYRILHGTLIAGVLTIAVSMALFLADPSLVLWRTKFDYIKDFTGTFINRGAAGAWMCLIASTSLVLLLRTLETLSIGFIPAGLNPVRHLVACFFEKPIVITLLSLAVVAAGFGVLMTGSRAAALALMGSFALILAVVWYFRMSTVRVRAALTVASLAAALGVFQFAGAKVTGRIAQSGLFEEGRWAIWTSSLRAVAERPLIGWGAGTFRDVFPLVRSDSLAAAGEVRNAHSLPLELAVESGLPLAAALSAIWVILTLALIRSLLRSSGFDAVRLAGVLAALSAAGLTSIDVVSHTFGYVAPVLLVVGIAIGQSAHRR